MVIAVIKTKDRNIMSNKDDVQSMETRIQSALFAAFDEVNSSLPPERRLEKSTNTILLGAGGKIDSLGLTILIVAVEQKIEEECGEVISLVDANTMSEEHSPFLNVEKLTQYIKQLIEAK